MPVATTRSSRLVNTAVRTWLRCNDVDKAQSSGPTSITETGRLSGKRNPKNKHGRHQAEAAAGLAPSSTANEQGSLPR
jgi:hypothetical protein